MTKFAAVILVVFFGFLSSGDCRCPTPTLPANSNDKYYQGFQKVPSKKETADKLKKNFLRPGQGNGVLENTVIVMDGSGSVGSCEFNKGKQALANLARFGNDGGAYDIKFACVTFSSSATTNFNFLSSTTAAARLNNLYYPGGGTNTQSGLGHAKTLFEKNSRRNARKIVFLVTDVQSNIQQANTVPNAKALKDIGADIYVVAVGTYIHGIDEMVRVASYPPEKYMFRVQKLQNFLEVVKLVIKEVSPGNYKAVYGQHNSSC